MEIKYPEIYDESYKILKSVYGEDADFRDGQYEAIEATMTNKRTLIVVKFVICSSKPMLPPL